MSKRINFRTGVNKDQTRYYIDEIPDDLWEEFREKAKKYFPEKGNNAWAEYLANSISSLLDGEKSTFIVTDIPPSALGSMGRANEDAGTHNLALFVRLLESAKRGKYHVINFDDETEDTHCLVILNTPDKFWKILEDITLQANTVRKETKNTAVMLAELITSIADVGLNINVTPTDKK